MVKYFKQAGLKKNDVVCIGASGSFPALTLATLCAAEALELKPLVIYSVGASMYGANLPEFTFLDMLKAISDKKILPFSVIAVSLGGHGDSAEGMFFPDSRKRMLEIVENSGLPFISEKDIHKSIQKRLAIYAEHAGNSLNKCFVNVGGASANFGDSEDSVAFPNGLVTEVPPLPPGPGEGLIFHFIRSGVPVIHLLNVKGLSAANGIPYDPIPFPKPGTSRVFRQNQAPEK
jgi:poly-gamma-glutamate system protein